MRRIFRRSARPSELDIRRRQYAADQHASQPRQGSIALPNHALAEGLQRASAGGNGADPLHPDVARKIHASVGTGRPLQSATRREMEAFFGVDLNAVQVHTDDGADEMTRSLQAKAFTTGSDVFFRSDTFDPDSANGRELLAHELAHVTGASRSPGSPQSVDAPDSAEERRADAVARRYSAGEPAPPDATPPLAASPGSIHRTIEMRDVGRGEQSGLARLPELIERLNGMAQGVSYTMTGRELTYQVTDETNIGHFDQQMIGFIDQEPVIPLRLTNRHGLLGSPAGGFNAQVVADSYVTGYVDIDDLLSSTDLGLQTILVHFITERSETRGYARRIGSNTFTQAEFNRTHRAGINAEVALLRDFFGDPTIRFTSDSVNRTLIRMYTNSRRDWIRMRASHGRGEQRNVLTAYIDVKQRSDNAVMTADQYRALLEQERAEAEAPEDVAPAEEPVAEEEEEAAAAAQ